MCIAYADPNHYIIRPQILVSLGPTEYFFGKGECENGFRDGLQVEPLAGEEVSSDSAATGGIRIHPDKLSCAQLILAAVRKLAKSKIKVLAADVKLSARQLGYVSICRIFS